MKSRTALALSAAAAALIAAMASPAALAATAASEHAAGTTAPAAQTAQDEPPLYRCQQLRVDSSTTVEGIGCIPPTNPEERFIIQDPQRTYLCGRGFYNGPYLLGFECVRL
ncbi:hypothetical protein [Streptomyces acidicola]|uniref:hypothetical protein n=1 Tax=Streptomyces acidicola TaxID=2596892 RepID=UPI0034321A62